MPPSRLNFQLEARATGSQARAARFQTLHNEVLTPLFMPVGTQATVKAQLPETLLASGSQILLANTYHLLLRPGPEVFVHFGGIHKFMGWERSVLTDSGGYQIFSLPNSRSMGEQGAVFKSYMDGKKVLLSPELSIQTQRAIGADIMMALDQCVPSTSTEEVARAAVEITQRWAIRSLAAREDSQQSLFAIVQGALFPQLRRDSAASLVDLPFDGFAIGGLAVGEEREDRENMCELAASLLPVDRPRYLMGVGTPHDVLEAVHRGVDMFDCIIPTKLAQQGVAYTSRGVVQLRRAIYKFSNDPLDPVCTCPVCQKYTRGYLHHLTKTQEALGWQLMGQHNIAFYHDLMRDIRASIFNDTFLSLYAERRAILDLDDVDFPTIPTPIAKPRPAVPTTLGAYEVIVAEEGFSSIRHIASGEIMHSHTPPIDEANALYIEQSQLAQRLQLAPGETPENTSPFVIWDVGLGAAANAIAALRCYEEQAAQGPIRRLHVVSFENDLDALRLALYHKGGFPYLRHGAADTLLRRAYWASRRFPGLTWKLYEGDYFQRVLEQTAPPDLVFWDFYSSRTHGDAWTLPAFEQLFSACGGHQAELVTYSTSTRVRSALLAAGFYVGHGRSIGVKSETTVALIPGFAEPCRYPLLSGAWLAKWHRSQARFPEGLAPSETAAFEAKIVDHPQFLRTATER